MFDKFDELKNVIAKIELEVNRAKAIFNDLGVDMNNKEVFSDFSEKARTLGSEKIEGTSKIVEGVFDGQQMIGPDGKQYSIPANYCSKSKLVEGDILKLVIKDDGSFIYKQIGPIERKRLKGVLFKDPVTGDYKVNAPGREYKVIKASVTYFHGNHGDDVIILVPEDGESIWAAVENIINAANQNNINSVNYSIDNSEFENNNQVQVDSIDYTKSDLGFESKVIEEVEAKEEGEGSSSDILDDINI